MQVLYKKVIKIYLSAQKYKFKYEAWSLNICWVYLYFKILILKTFKTVYF